MTPACSTRFSAYRPDSAPHCAVEKSVRPFGAAFNSTGYRLGGGVSVEFLARHTTDLSLVKNPYCFQVNDFWNSHTACVVDPALSIPTNRDIAPTCCQWRSVTEQPTATSSSRTDPVAAPGGAPRPSSDDASGATSLTAGAVGGVAETIFAAYSQVRSSDACLQSMERRLEEILVSIKIPAGVERIAVVSPAEESSDNRCLPGAGLENLVRRLDRVLNYLKTPTGIEESGAFSPAEEPSDSQRFHDTSLEETENQRKEYNAAVEQKLSPPVAKLRLQPATDQSSRHQPTRNDSHELDRAIASLTDLRCRVLEVCKKIGNNCSPIRQQLSEQKRLEQPQLQRDTQQEQARLPTPETIPCEHYQRNCLLRFPCCSDYYPCHRCHNNHSKCGNTELKALHAIRLKCAECLVEQEIDEDSQHCSSCGIKLSEYFCVICKHFTSVNKNPYHCHKCGICRITSDESFHCDVCNVCLNKRLKGNHKCRADSGHEECCICFEDAFSGCLILPCSHKLHRECAIALVQNKVRTCPVCRHPLQ